MSEDDLKVLEAQKKFLMEYQVSNFNRGESYTKLVLLAGVGGFFAMWSLVKEHVPGPLLLLAALSMIVAVLCFVGFEIIKMIILGRATMAFARLIESKVGMPPRDFLQLYREEEIKSSVSLASLHVWWIIALIPTVAFGVIAVGLLAYTLVRQLLTQMV